MDKLIAVLCCLMLAAPLPAIAQVKGKVDEKQQAALAKKQKDEAERKAFMARVTQCDQRAKDKGLKGSGHKNFMRDCMRG